MQGLRVNKVRTKIMKIESKKIEDECMRTHYIYLEDKIIDEIPAKSREQARKLFIEKYKEWI